MLPAFFVKNQKMYRLFAQFVVQYTDDNNVLKRDAL